MTREEIIKGLKSVKEEFGRHFNEGFAWICQPIDEAIKVLSSIEQIRWERDVAIEQLKELGYGLGEKIRTSKDTISREETLNVMHALMDNARIGEEDDDYETLDDIKEQYLEIVKGMVSVQPISENEKEIYSRGWKDGAEATAYHVELCEEENPTIPISVIEDIKAELTSCLDACNNILRMGVFIEPKSNIEARKITYEQCLEIIDKRAYQIREDSE